MFVVYRIGISKSGWLDPMLTHVEDPAKSDHPSILSPSTNVFNYWTFSAQERWSVPWSCYAKAWGTGVGNNSGAPLSPTSSS
ncbi:unnamed protein product [[Candida] boidinii]|nr:unnamed protein product [[Candida] boidinii]